MGYIELKQFLSDKEALLIAVSKKRSVEQIMALYDKGQRHFGENRVSELLEKKAALPDDIMWHMIGNLQRKKIKKIAPFISMIHSVDNATLAESINEAGARAERVIDVLLQVKIAQEESKSGFSIEELKAQILDLDKLDHTQVRGLMGMATYTDDADIVRKEFKSLYDLFQDANTLINSPADFDTLSMGMSGDYRIAVEEGSTMVRIGSLLF